MRIRVVTTMGPKNSRNVMHYGSMLSVPSRIVRRPLWLAGFPSVQSLGGQNSRRNFVRNEGYHPVSFPHYWFQTGANITVQSPTFVPVIMMTFWPKTTSRRSAEVSRRMQSRQCCLRETSAVFFLRRLLKGHTTCLGRR